MLIHRIAAQLYTAEALQTVEAGLDAGEDVTLAVSQSGRTLMAAAQFARRPRPTVYIVSGEDAADRAARGLAAYVGLAHVCRFPERKDYPWREQAPDDAVVAQRCEALGRIVRGDNCIMVASARALLRCVPPVESRYWESTTFAVGEEIPFDEVPQRLVGMGYTNAGAADAPGLFRVHGDTVEVFPAQEKAPVRIEFFGDEIDRIRRMVSSTGQTIGNEDSIEIFPCRELALTDDAVHNMHVALYRASQDDSKLAALLEMVDARIVTPELDRFLPVMYGQTVSPLSHVSGKALVVLSEPRSLFDDCLRAYEDIEARAGEAGVDRLDGLYVRAQQLDFGSQQRLNYVSLIRAGGAVTAELKIEQPAIAGSDNRFMTRIQEVVGKRYACVFAIPDRGARESMELTFGDGGITFEESLTAAPENAGAIGDRVRVAAADSADRAARQEAHASIRERKADALNARSLEAGAAQAAAGAAVPTISRGRVTFVDAALPQGVVVPDANLAVFSIADLNARMDANRARSRRKVDITQITFPFKPGDYVVHATHGIALFSEIARQEVGGKERDYFLLEYADGDKLYVPLEQVDRITRYVGPDGDKPRLTRLNTADWTRATNKARKNAKKLAFDLVDLYTRRSSITGIACPPDTPEQIEMEESFPYDETRDQLEAIADIKADMEAPKPMDRLLCGDVGFGKTEVALRAAFKCVDSGRQVMVLCPTTILAQQHYETFFERFAPFGLEVEVLSRFRTPAQQKRALKAFAEGTIDVLIGTHRLLSADVNPKNLGLVIIDEEQRFGVQHKEQLKNLREQIDVLTLSATPIPRTMQMATSGVRDMSLITTPPTGRRPVIVHVGEYDPDVVSAAIRLEVGRGGQVYYVSNRVKTIDDAVARVHEAAPEARVGVAHGKMSPREVEDVMIEFATKKIDVLIATTIVESGIDNATANTLIIEDSQRLGLAQLYQLKGRVGRSATQAYAYFMFPGELPLTEEATARLTALSEFQDLGSGMRIAMRDLEIRGAGSLMGAEQHGNLSSVGFDLFTQMLGQAVAEARVGVAHGKMSPREVEDVMIEFATKKIDVLIATTIVESGIDNATANTLIIEDSQRLGLAQLYQLKGRVGRSATQAYAYFMFPGELPLTEEATARLTALSEFQDLGSGMRIAMRDLEIRGAGSLMGAEQHGNLSSVGFDLFTQMLGQAVAEARGDDDAGVEAASVGINLPADYFLSEEYLPAVDQRVLVYRKLAAAEDLESIDEVQEETEAAHGELPLAGLNLFNRARIRIRGERLGLESVTLSGGRITFLGVDVPKKVAYELKTRYGAVNFPKSRKLSVPYKAGAGAGSGLGRGLDANDGTGPVAAALMLLQQLGASDDD